MTPHDPPLRPVLFGEVLFDTFPDGRQVLGGAPFNVAWHLHGWGARPLFISRIGRDAAGDAIVEAMERWGMDCSGIQRDDHHPTGRVAVRIEHGEPGFDILDDQAYDHIAADELPAMPEARLLYHGTLVLRHPQSAEALKRIMAGSDVFLDVNLRTPWWHADEVKEFVTNARWVKLNHNELQQLEPGTPPAGDCDQSSLRAAGLKFQHRYAIDTLMVTCGGAGAVLFNRTARALHEPAAPVTEFRDSVGAGDAFSSVAMLALIHGWPPQRILQRAQQFAAAVCAMPGATGFDKGLYHRFIERWEWEP